eukprot:TRINITY_DN6780_c0_g1_i1.p1 TRINITY_DN6780_c0_g1~~TRINITY_DN6780_c0_g1_i1.p1  ORF type:complete len:193 (-),score=61.50 TRINITY_DN6780_c0_g1_i1:128-706(-)
MNNLAQSKIEKAKVMNKFYTEVEKQIIDIKLYYLGKLTHFSLIEINNTQKSNTKPTILNAILWIDNYNKKLHLKKTNPNEEEIPQVEKIEMSKITNVENLSPQEGLKYGLDENQIQMAFNILMGDTTLCLISFSKEKKTSWMDGLLILIGKEKFTSNQMAMELNELLEIKYEIDLIQQRNNSAPTVPPQPRI